MVMSINILTKRERGRVTSKLDGISYWSNNGIIITNELGTVLKEINSTCNVFYPGSRLYIRGIECIRHKIKEILTD